MGSSLPLMPPGLGSDEQHYRVVFWWSWNGTMVGARTRDRGGLGTLNLDYDNHWHLMIEPGFGTLVGRTHVEGAEGTSGLTSYISQRKSHVCCYP